jgi:hypothetical protein
VAVSWLKKGKGNCDSRATGKGKQHTDQQWSGEKRKSNFYSTRMKRITVVVALWVMVVGTASAQKAGSEQQLAKEAHTHFGAGDFLKAYPIYSQLVSLYPGNEEYLYRFGACAIYSDPDKTKAVQYLTSATKKDVKDPMAWYYLGKAYHLNYQFRDAVKAYETFVSKSDPKMASKMNAQREIETCIYGSNLLANIKDVQVLNKVEADRANFFRYMNLEGVGGRILTVPDELRTSYDKKQKETGVIHYPGNSTAIYFSSYGKDGSTGKDIYRANLLPDGKFSAPEKLKGDVNTKYDEDYCFMQSDGKTLYFSSRGHNSMGGYDIFKSMYDPSSDSFGPAINLDFAINTPDDDIFFIADSLNQRAYFASGRSSDQSHIHVYGVRVQGIPMQIIYLKGEFLSEIDPSQKNARIQVKEDISGRLIMDVTSDEANGAYILYVPKAGKYNFVVRTENSPVLHQAVVDIPSFEKPVALRQEMRLTNQDGQEKLVVTNHFDMPLDEDLATLASGMLREKSRLEVNVAEEDITEPAAVAVAVERDMKNTALAAGFAEGVSAIQVTDAMNREAAEIEKFVAESEQKYTNAYAYAQKKFFEAEAALAQAEMIRETSGNLQTEEEVAQAREMLKLLSKASDLQREARSAMAAAESVKLYKESEAARGEAIRNSANAIKASESNGDFDATVRELMNEKARQNKMRETPATPYDELLAKARAKESELRSSEDKLTRLREEEKRLSVELKAAQQVAMAAKKKSEKQNAENQVIAIQGELDAKRRQIVQDKIRTEELGARSKDAIASAGFFKRLSTDTQLGLSADQRVALDETQRAAITMKINAMDARIGSLQVTDPQMLALITEGQDEPVASTTADAALSSTPSAVAALPVRSNTEITGRKEQALARVPQSDPLAPQMRHMILSNTIEEMNGRISAIEMKRTTGITTLEKNELDALKASRNAAQNELSAVKVKETPASAEQARQTYLTVNPEYTNQITALNAAESSELERVGAMIQIKSATLERMRAERLMNASAAFEETDANRLSERTRRDGELASAIATLESELNPAKMYRTAYESENKELVEGNLTAAARLDGQMALTETYLSALRSAESKQQQLLAAETDQEKSVAIRIRIGELNKETELAETRLQSYSQDRALATSTSGPAVAASPVVAPVNTLEDQLEVEENTRLEGAEKLSAKMSEAELAKKVEADAETIKALFKTKSEGESIFAYETGELMEVLEKYDPNAEKIRNLDKINEIQQQIFMIEAEIETEQNLTKQRKLDRKAEDLYFRKSIMEIGNATAIQEMMAAEYTETRKATEDFRIAQADVINSRTMVRDEIKKLMNQSKSEYEEAQELRKQAENVKDDIEKNDYYRRAFAKEQLAVQLLNQATAIGEQLPLLTEYDDSELAELRYGNPSKVSTAMNEEAKGETKTNTETAAGVDATITEAVSAGTAETTANSTKTEKTANVSPAGITYVEYGAGEASTDRRSVRAEGNNTEKVTVAAPAAETESTSAPARVAATAPVRPTAPAVSPEARANAGSYSESEAANYYYEFPATLTKDLFALTSNSPYSDARPIPVDVMMPSGVYYKVQVGAFRNNIPQNLYGEFAPVSGETLNNGITRYTAGFFMNLDNADQAKMTIRRMGYSDAFIVAFRDGKRIPLYEAMGMTEKDYQAAVEKEYVYGDGGEAPSNRNAAKPVTMNPGANSGKRTDYYKGAPDAAPAIQVEAVSGLFYTVQIGVYSKPVPATTLGNMMPFNSELTSTGKIRYTAGMLSDLKDAVSKREQAKAAGIADAFITAYYNGERITLSEADRLMKEYGPSVFARP